MDNMRFYTQLKNTPAEAKRTINDGKLKGKTDINPMHRLELMTKTFGPCGIGWKYEITEKTAIPIPDRQEMMCFVDILLYIKEGDAWSDPIPGTGGSMLVENFRNAGIKSNDDGYKMALTDALSVAMKALGMSADVYYALGETKYNRPLGEPAKPPANVTNTPPEEMTLTWKDQVGIIMRTNRIKADVFNAACEALIQDGKIPNKPLESYGPADWTKLKPLITEFVQATKR